MTRLERLGFEVAAAQWLELHRGYGRLLMVLVQARGAVVNHDALLKGDLRKCEAEPSRRGLAVRLCHLRLALADVGAPVVLKNVRGVGYQLTGDLPGLFAILEATA